MPVSVENLQHPLKAAPGRANNNTLQVEEVRIEQEVYHALLIVRVSSAYVGRDYQSRAVEVLREGF